MSAEIYHLAVGETFYYVEALCGAQADFYYREVSTFLEVDIMFPKWKSCDECRAVLLGLGLVAIELARSL